MSPSSSATKNTGLEAVRPDPDALLADIQAQAAQSLKGRLKIFFGASAGVGKTYAMLSAAHAAQVQGQALIVGLVETHGRSDTQALLAGLPLLPRKSMAHRERSLEEFDLDAALAFGAQQLAAGQRPLLLLDELAHSNAPGSRHPKRWQDAQELLDAGIDVWSTMNVQHLESLNDIVSGITGVRVWETVPDTFFDAADEVLVVDLPPDELLARLNAGKVYIPTQAQRAANNFFRKGNLIALRELALRRTADRVDHQMRNWRRASQSGSSEKPVWATRDAVLACIGAGSGSEAIVRSAARLATQADLAWHAIFIELPRHSKLATEQRQQIMRTLQLAQDLGATVASPFGDNLPSALVDYAREHNLSRLVIGRRAGKHWPWQTPLSAQLAALAPEMDVLQIPLAAARSASASSSRQDEAKTPQQNPHPSWPGYAAAALACAGITLLAGALHGILELTNIVMLFLLAVVGVALRYGRGPAALAAVLGVLMFDFFFVAPVLSFSVSDAQYLITFAVMLMVALVIGQLTASLRAQAQAARERERRVRGLYQMARDLSAALLPEQIAEIAARFLHSEFTAQSALLTLDDEHRLQLEKGGQIAVDMAVAQWCVDKGEAAGQGTHTLPACPSLMLPLKAPMRLRGVLAVQMPPAATLSPEQRQLLDTCASLLAISLERLHYIQVAQQTTLQIESERLRNSLLSAISHDIRTPLTALLGLAESLNLSQPALPAAQAEIASAMYSSAQRMHALVNNLLDMARLEAGSVQLRLAWLPLEELVGSALHAAAAALQQRPIHTHLPADLPLLHLDAALMERVLVNLLENAAKYTPAHSPLRLSARVQGQSVAITLDDEGPGLPLGREAAIFEKFERGHKESATPGVGLGLAIARAIVQAHGGSITGENRMAEQRILGARFTIILPCGQPPLDDGSAAFLLLAPAPQ